MGNVWTHGVWTVKQGREDEFVALWRDLAARRVAELRTAAPPTLLRDRDNPNVFVSFGPWPTLDEIRTYRTSLFHEAYQRMTDLLDSFESRTLDEVVRG